MGFTAAALVLHILSLLLLSQGYVIDESYEALRKYPHAFKEVEDAMKELEEWGRLGKSQVTLDEDQYDDTKRQMFGHNALHLGKAQGIVQPKQPTTLADPLTR
jgi:hypothetical protein